MSAAGTTLRLQRRCRSVADSPIIHEVAQITRESVVDGPMGGGAALEEGTHFTLDYLKLDKVASKKCDVVPVVVQDSRTGRVLIVAYANDVALAETFKWRVCCLWSTSRNELWVKGMTSGDTLDLDDVLVNCEQNSLLMLVHPRRKGACHTKDASGQTRVSCYYRRLVAAADGSLTLGHLGDEFVPRWGAAGGGGTGVSVAAATVLAVAAAAAAALATAAVLTARRR